MEMEIKQNQTDRMFYITLGDELAYVKYAIVDDVFDIVSTVVPKSHGGQGIAAKLVLEAYTYAKSKGYRLQGSCSYADVWLTRHPEFLT